MTSQGLWGFWRVAALVPSEGVQVYTHMLTARVMTVQVRHLSKSLTRC